MTDCNCGVCDQCVWAAEDEEAAQPFIESAMLPDNGACGSPGCTSCGTEDSPVQVGRRKPRWRQGTYEQFAAILGEYAHDEFSRDDLIRGFSDLFACDNPRFNPDLFRDQVIQGWMMRGGNI